MNQPMLMPKLIQRGQMSSCTCRTGTGGVFTLPLNTLLNNTTMNKKSFGYQRPWADFTLQVFHPGDTPCHSNENIIHTSDRNHIHIVIQLYIETAVFCKVEFVLAL